jgi:hypothetical protein
MTPRVNFEPSRANGWSEAALGSDAEVWRLFAAAQRCYGRLQA